MSGFRPAWPGQVCSLGWQIWDQIETDLGLRLTKEQAARLVRLYEIGPTTGQRLVRRAALRRPKGAGKSPEGGYISYAELVAPTVFVDWDEAGQPIAEPHPSPWIQLAAVSEDQTDNVMVWLFDTLADRPEICAQRGIDLGRTRIYLTDRPGRIEPVTAAAGSREGQRITFAVLDQTESWYRSNGGRSMAATLRRNAGKMGGWTYELQNAPEPGDGSVADETARAAERAAAGVLYDARPAPEIEDLSDRPALIGALEVSYGESAKSLGGWVDLERIADEVQDPATDPSEARRYYLNQTVARSERAFDSVKWATLGGGKIEPGATVVVGFDGARFHDATAMVVCDVVAGTTMLAGLWESEGESEGWEVPEHEVTAALADVFDRYEVWRVYCDPPYWSSTIAAWSGRWGAERIIDWWTNRPRAIGYACRNLAEAIRAGEVHHCDDARLTLHLRNALRRDVNTRTDDGHRLWTLRKETEDRKIDAAMALVLAWEARNDAIAAGATNVKPAKSKALHRFF